jgi:ribosomal protein S8
MVARFPSMIAIIRNTILTGAQSCVIPVNSLCVRVLRLLRNHGFIYGFSYVSSRPKKCRLYPLVRVTLKYADNNSPVLSNIGVFKNTRSNFIQIKANKQYHILSHRNLFILTTPKGLIITSLHNLYSNYNLKSLKGKLLVELSV